MQFAVLLALAATAFAANNVGEMTGTACSGTTVSNFDVVAGQSTCYPQQGSSLFISTGSITCAAQLFTSADCTGTAYDEMPSTYAACLTEQGTGGSFLITC